jgi:uncharacterized protein (TIGR02145 family)
MNIMVYALRKKMLTVLLVLFISSTSLSAEAGHSLADTQRHAAVSTITSFILNSPSGIVHNGKTYDTVTSPYTDKVWLDRNLGAARVCTSFDDAQCYGDYYQWGRNYDGHQNSISGTIQAQASDVSNAGTEFIITFGDWASADNDGSQRMANWSKTDGSSACPAGFRVPTIGEFKAELFDPDSASIQNRDDAYSSFLKLPSAGLRSGQSGSMISVGSVGLVWTDSVEADGAYGPYWRSNRATWIDFYRNRYNGKTVRCLRD